MAQVESKRQGWLVGNGIVSVLRFFTEPYQSVITVDFSVSGLILVSTPDC